VNRKEYVRFDAKTHSYLSEDGYPIGVRRGQEQWRIYYRINHFGEVERSVEARLLQMEEDRVVKHGPRFRSVWSAPQK